MKFTFNLGRFEVKGWLFWFDRQKRMFGWSIWLGWAESKPVKVFGFHAHKAR